MSILGCYYYQWSVITILHRWALLDMQGRIYDINDRCGSPIMTGTGFEPAPPKWLVPKTSALDHSAILPCLTVRTESTTLPALSALPVLSKMKFILCLAFVFHKWDNPNPNPNKGKYKFVMNPLHERSWFEPGSDHKVFTFKTFPIVFLLH